jgi:lipoprotein-anchoring transpeptidase ErfK/SrfK
MLDRAGFSPGVIDGRMGRNTKEALAESQRHGAATAPAPEPLTAYTITREDTSGPFVPDVPRDLVQQASLPSLAYTSVMELLAERFHTTPAVLQQLNPGATFGEGEQIQVPNVDPLVLPIERPAFSEAQTPEKKAARPPARQPNTSVLRPDVVVTVSKSRAALTVTDQSGRVIFYAPVTTGSQRDVLPLGEWKVKGTQLNPVFHYNPELFWDADPSHSKARIPSGPNNPVGLVWIDLDKEHYGIHGTPEPAAIGRTESHGCVRLTNWDALKVAGMVKPGTKVLFTE